jgi:hypothetical protein
MAGTTTTSRDNLGHINGAIRDLVIQFNKMIDNLATIAAGANGTGVVVAFVLSIGTTVTLAVSAGTIMINGVTSVLTAVAAQAFGALGTVPASKWALISVERVAAGTVSFVSAAANYSTGYATEALALAAIPAITANKVRVGYITILASASTWIAGTDALAGGTGGNPATTTNYYNDPAAFGTGALTGTTAAGKIGDVNGVAITT